MATSEDRRRADQAGTSCVASGNRIRGGAAIHAVLGAVPVTHHGRPVRVRHSWPGDKSPDYAARAIYQNRLEH